MQPTMLVRHSKPSIYDQAPKGTQCTVLGEEDIYVQLSDDEENPRWEAISSLPASISQVS